MKTIGSKSLLLAALTIFSLYLLANLARISNDTFKYRIQEFQSNFIAFTDNSHESVTKYKDKTRRNPSRVLNENVKGETYEDESSLRSICESKDTATGKDHYFMVIFIPSQPGLSLHRHYLRTKWLNVSRWRRDEFGGIDRRCLTFKLMFAIGKVRNEEHSEQILGESFMHDDIYLMNIEEGEESLPLKLLFGFKKSIELYTFDYFVKVDHDTLIDLPNLVRGLATTKRNNVYTGFCHKKLRNTPYKMKFEYCLGGGYVLSRDLVEKVSFLDDKQTALSIPFEDGYVGYLVWTVAKQHSIPGPIPQTNPAILQFFTRRDVQFNKYFYHWLKGLNNADRVFECRIAANKTTCPEMRFLILKEDNKCICEKKLVT